MRLARNCHGLLLTVDDNGVGSRAREGNGLRGMRERVEGLQGRMRFTAGDGGGTHLSVELPSVPPTGFIALPSRQEAHA